MPNDNNNPSLAYLLELEARIGKLETLVQALIDERYSGHTGQAKRALEVIRAQALKHETPIAQQEK